MAKKKVSNGSIPKTILHQGTVPGISGVFAVEKGVCVP